MSARRWVTVAECSLPVLKVRRRWRLPGQPEEFSPTPDTVIRRGDDVVLTGGQVRRFMGAWGSGDCEWADHEPDADPGEWSRRVDAACTEMDSEIAAVPSREWSPEIKALLIQGYRRLVDVINS